MKRYWLSITLVIFILLCVGTFYILAAQKHSPEFILKKQLGAEEEIKNVSIGGTYGQGRMIPGVTISLAGSKYADEWSFFERLDSYLGYDEEIKQLVKEHRHFMRGKRSPSLFYHDENLLVYADIKSDHSRSNFNVSILDKKQNKTFTFETPVPNANLYSYMNVQDVQVFGNEMIMMTQAFAKGSDRPEFRRYSLDLKDGKVLTDQLIEFSQKASNDLNMNYDVRRVYETDLTAPQRYNVFIEELSKDVVRTDNSVNTDKKGIVRDAVHAQEIVSAKAIVYDLQSGQMKEINSPEVVDFFSSRPDANYRNYRIDEGTLYITYSGAQESRSVIEYNLIEGKAARHEIKAHEVIASTIKDHYLYMVTKEGQNSFEQPLVSIVDLDSDEQVYQGWIGLKGTDRNPLEEMKKLQIFQVNVK